jgi:hypothetical protein
MSASLGKVALGLASLVMGAKYLHAGAKHLSAAPEDRGAGPRFGLGSLDRAHMDSGYVKTGKGPMRMRTYTIRNLDERIRHLRRLVHEGKRDPAVYAFVRDAISRRCGDDWCIREKDNLSEARAIFDAARKRVRYTSDIAGVDTYQKPAHTLALRSGDCLPGETRLLREDGTTVMLENVKIGERIFDGTGWTTVTQFWHKGVQPVLGLKLNNGSFFRCTKDHLLFRVPHGGSASEAFEVRAGQIEVTDELLQPKELVFPEGERLTQDEGFLIGLYLAEGSVRRSRVDGALATISIAGIANGKGYRERLLGGVAERLGLRVSEQERELYLTASDDTLERLLGGLGKYAPEKALKHTRYTPESAGYILEGLEADGGFADSGTFVFSTTSQTLALQYRLLQRTQGRSCHMQCVVEHGGLGENPIFRVTVRTGNRRPWAKVRAIYDAGVSNVFDIETDSGRFYVPQADIVVHNCDDYSSLLCSALLSAGIPCRFKVIRTVNGNDWNHIYVQAGFPRADPKKWISLDASVPTSFGWEAPSHMIADQRVFPVG